MNKVITFTMIIITFAVLLLSIIPLVFITTYVFTGYNKDSFIAILQLIPADRFWLVGLPLFVMCYVSTFYLLLKFFKLGGNKRVLFKQKIVYRLEDADINDKLSELMSGDKNNSKDKK
jgi:hypothetical protein